MYLGIVSSSLHLYVSLRYEGLKLILLIRFTSKSTILHISEEYLIRYGYLIKEFGNHGGVSYRKEVWNQAYVEVSLGYKSSIGRSFDTDQEAKDWINKLKEMSSKDFETVIYEWKS